MIDAYQHRSNVPYRHRAATHRLRCTLDKLTARHYNDVNLPSRSLGYAITHGAAPTTAADTHCPGP